MSCGVIVHESFKLIIMLIGGAEGDIGSVIVRGSALSEPVPVCRFRVRR